MWPRLLGCPIGALLVISDAVGRIEVGGTGRNIENVKGAAGRRKAVLEERCHCACERGPGRSFFDCALAFAPIYTRFSFERNM
jgi:hypothetical protein